jgi:cell shape-determining protein MreD
MLGVFLLILQSLLSYAGVASWLIPQGLLVCVVFLGFYECSIGGAVCTFLLGLLLDMSSGIILGPWAGAYTISYFVLVIISQRLFVESIMVAITTVFLCTIFTGGIFLALAFEYQALSRGDIYTLLGQGLTSACVTPAVFIFLTRVWRRVGALSAKRGSVVSAV